MLLSVVVEQQHGAESVVFFVGQFLMLVQEVGVAGTDGLFVQVDGHHRAVASSINGYETVDSYVIDLGQDIKLGMEKTADKAGIKTFDDIEIIDDDKHPLIALTESMQERESKGDD